MSDSEPYLAHLLQDGLQCWLWGLPPPLLHMAPASVIHIHQRESLVGSEQLFYGQFALAWADHQDEYLHHIGQQSLTKNRMTGQGKVIQTIWTHILTNWLHTEWMISTEWTLLHGKLHCCPKLREKHKAYMMSDIWLFHKTEIYCIPHCKLTFTPNLPHMVCTSDSTHGNCSYWPALMKAPRPMLIQTSAS